ncbi:MAG: hypothetical protein LC107_01605 [Chitinophagales bacterium]|nr:hypothetical protein [Chitinophagales bacterium]
MFKSYLKLISFIVFFIFNTIYAISQNPTIKIFYEDIYPFLDVNYDKAKNAYIQYTAMKATSKFLPSFLENLSYYAFVNDDFDFAFSLADSLIQNYGFQISPPIGQFEKSYFYELLVSKNVYNKFSMIQDSLLPIYYKNNFRSLYVKERINECVFKDILLSNIMFEFPDSSCLKEPYYSILSNEDAISISIIEKICKKEGRMINNFDHGIETAQYVEFIFLHSLKNPKNIERIRQILSQYAESTYLEGKIDYNLFKLFDKWEYYHTGYQSYGTIKDAPYKYNKSKLINNDFNIDK